MPGWAGREPILGIPPLIRNPGNSRAMSQVILTSVIRCFIHRFELTGLPVPIGRTG